MRQRRRNINKKIDRQKERQGESKREGLMDTVVAYTKASICLGLPMLSVIVKWVSI